MIAMAICEIGSLAERRIAMLVDPALSGLPAFLTPQPGLNSGFMIPQVTAAALVSENKQRAYPASVDSIPTSANQEDHVSMAAHGARRLVADGRERRRDRRHRDPGGRPGLRLPRAAELERAARGGAGTPPRRTCRTWKTTGISTPTSQAAIALVRDGAVIEAAGEARPAGHRGRAMTSVPPGLTSGAATRR